MEGRDGVRNVVRVEETIITNLGITPKPLVLEPSSDFQTPCKICPSQAESEPEIFFRLYEDKEIFPHESES